MLDTKVLQEEDDADSECIFAWRKIKRGENDYIEPVFRLVQLKNAFESFQQSGFSILADGATVGADTSGGTCLATLDLQAIAYGVECTYRWITRCIPRPSAGDSLLDRIESATGSRRNSHSARPKWGVDFAGSIAINVAGLADQFVGFAVAVSVHAILCRFVYGAPI